MAEQITLTLPEGLGDTLDAMARSSGATRDEVARKAIEASAAIWRLDLLRERMIPTARAQGVMTDEDVFARVS